MHTMDTSLGMTVRLRYGNYDTWGHTDGIPCLKGREKCVGGRGHERMGCLALWFLYVFDVIDSPFPFVGWIQ